jgi:hypothetical protein
MPCYARFSSLINKDKNHVAPITVPANLGANRKISEPKTINPRDMNKDCFA